LRKHVLVVAREIPSRARIASILHSAGYAVELAEGQKRALELAAREDIEAAIVVHSTELSGLEQELHDKLPKTIVLGHGTVNVVRPNHSLRGAEAPEALDEQKLLDRLGQASRGKRDTAATKTLKIGGCKLHLAGHTFFDGKGRETQLTRAQIRLLAAFLDSPRHVLSRDQLSHAVFGHGAELYDRNVDILVARLRRKIEPDAKSPAFILTVPGVGYKFAVQPQSVEDSKSLPATDQEQFNRSAGGEVMPASGSGQGVSDSEKRQLTLLSCERLAPRRSHSTWTRKILKSSSDVSKKFAPKS